MNAPNSPASPPARSTHACTHTHTRTHTHTKKTKKATAALGAAESDTQDASPSQPEETSLKKKKKKKKTAPLTQAAPASTPTSLKASKRTALDTQQTLAVQAGAAGDDRECPAGHHTPAAAHVDGKNSESTAVGAATGCLFTNLELGPKSLSSTVLSAINALGFRATTPVQQATIPLLLNHKDVAVQACTGSGMTVYVCVCVCACVCVCVTVYVYLYVYVHV